MSIRPDANDTFIFIPETSPAGAFSGKLTIDGFVLNAVQTDDPGVGSIRITKAGAVTFTATFADGTPDTVNNVSLGAAGTVTLGGTVTLADYSRIQVDAGTLTLSNTTNTFGGPGIPPGTIIVSVSTSDTVNNGGDIILSGIGGLGSDASSSLADWTIL
jgi:hypothetical protein